MKTYGLIGYPLTHSFSETYFNEKFDKEKRDDHFYCNFPLTDINFLPNLLDLYPDLCGFNVTIPYKEKIIPFLDKTDSLIDEIGAVNTVEITRYCEGILLKGYNTDVYGFNRSLHEWFAALKAKIPPRALILGTGGASKAVAYVLKSIGVTAHLISRRKGVGIYKTYTQLNANDFATHHLIVNTTPLGMFPFDEHAPDIPYNYISPQHYLYDLIYNPAETRFMRNGIQRGATAINGERMLHLQADKAWKIWNSNDPSTINDIFIEDDHL